MKEEQRLFHTIALSLYRQTVYRERERKKEREGKRERERERDRERGRGRERGGERREGGVRCSKPITSFPFSYPSTAWVSWHTGPLHAHRRAHTHTHTYAHTLSLTHIHTPSI